MLGILNLANIRVLLALNHALAARPGLYLMGLLLTDKVADLMTLLTLLALWFWREPAAQELLPPVVLPTRRDGAPTRFANWRLRRELDAALAPQVRKVTRLQSRAQLLTFAVAAISAYVLARVLAQFVDIDRPFATFLPVLGAHGAFEGLRTDGSFPSDHGALLGGFAVGMFYWNRVMGWFWLVLAAVLAVVRVAVGFHYPLDMLGGAFLGAVLVRASLQAYRRRSWFRNTMDTVALGFERSNEPYCYFLYGAVILVGLEFVMHFRHVIEMIQHIVGDLKWRFGKH